MGAVRRALTGVPGLVVAFVLVHAWLFAVDRYDTPLRAAGDVTIVYRAWIAAWQHGGPLVGLAAPGVYPVLALVPMLLAGLAGHARFLTAWLLLATGSNAVATVLLARRRIGLAWWFVAFELLLGPVATARIDAVAVVVAIAGVLAVERRPALAAGLFTAGAWVKVWPGMLLLGLVVARRRAAAAVVVALATSLVIVGVALVAGGRLSDLFSFVSAQSSRGLQIEAPVTAPWLWAVEARVPGARIFYDAGLVTFEVTGFGVRTAADLTSWLLAGGVLVVLACGILARRRGVPPAELLALTALGLVSAVIALNKVGSPQYCTWYVAPVLLGLLVAPRVFRFPAVLVLVLAALTQIIFPWFYRQILDAHAGMLVVLDVRDLLEVVLLGWAVGRLVVSGRGSEVVRSRDAGPRLAFGD